MDSDGSEEVLQEDVVDERVQEILADLNRLRLENCGYRASLATQEALKKDDDKNLTEIRSKLESSEKEQARLLSESQGLRDELYRTTKKLEQVTKRSQKLDINIQNLSAQHNELADKYEALEERALKVTDAEIQVRSKLEESIQTIRKKDAEIELFTETWSGELEDLKKGYEIIIKGLKEREEKTEKESAEKLRELEMKILELEGLLEEEKKKSTEKDAKISELTKSNHALIKVNKRREDSAKRTVERFPPRMARRDLNPPQPQAEANNSAEATTNLNRYFSLSLPRLPGRDGPGPQSQTEDNSTQES